MSVILKKCTRIIDKYILSFYVINLYLTGERIEIEDNMFRTALAKYTGLGLTDSVIMHFITNYKLIHNPSVETIKQSSKTDSAIKVSQSIDRP